MIQPPATSLKSAMKPFDTQPSLKQPQQRQVSFEQSASREMAPLDLKYLPWKKRMIKQWMANQAAKHTETPLVQRGAKRKRESDDDEPSREDRGLVLSTQDTVVMNQKPKHVVPPEQAMTESSASSVGITPVRPFLSTPVMKSGRPELLMAIRHKEFEKAKLLLALESTGNELVNAVDEKGRTPLMWAALQGQFELGHALLGKGATVNCAEDAGATPLMHAIRGGSPRLCKALLEKKADVHARDLKLKTTLMCAAAHDRSYLILPLLKAKVDPLLTDYKGYTALDYAVDAGSVDSAKTLLGQVYPGNPLNKTVLNMATINAERKKKQQQPSLFRP